MSERERIERLIEAFKGDPESVYNTWFINDDARLKAFGAIRRGVERVVSDIKRGTFPADFKGSSLEIVLKAITEQKQVFEGAAHAFYWKPKLRIPDIYENDANKTAFGQFLQACMEVNRGDRILAEISKLDRRGIKGLGPAAANILYFLHPTAIPPFNTAIVRGFNLLFSASMKLGSWSDYLNMRDLILRANEEFRDLLSKDLGAIAGLLFDIGVGKLPINENVSVAAERERKKTERMLRKRRREVESELDEENEHSRMQYLLLKIGHALGYDVYVASNDRSKSYGDEKFSFMTLSELPPLPVRDEVRKIIGLIDVIWLVKGTNRIVCAYEVERSTSIYSGVLRLSDLALSLPVPGEVFLYLVAPDKREAEVQAQLNRPSLCANERVRISYFLFSDLLTHCESICTLGDDHTIMQKVARCIC